MNVADAAAPEPVGAAGPGAVGPAGPGPAGAAGSEPWGVAGPGPGGAAGHPRSSGVQLHVTSLPGGTLGRDAYRFVDWLAEAGQTWWQVLPLGPPDRYRSPYKSSSAFAIWRGLLADPRAPVSTAEISAFRERQRFWIADWERFAGRGAVADQVRADREWGALRRYAGERGVRILGDLAIYVSPRGADHRLHPELFCTGYVAGAPPDAYSDDGQLWGNPLYDWPALQRRGYRWWVERVRRTLELFDTARIDHFRGLVAYWAVPEGARTAKDGEWRRGPGQGLFRALERELGRGPGGAEAGGAGAGGAPGVGGGPVRSGPGVGGGPVRSGPGVGGGPVRSGPGVGGGPGVGSGPSVRGPVDRGWSGPLHLPLIAEDLGVITAPVDRLRRELALPGMLVIQFGMDPEDPTSPHRLENHGTDRFVYTATHDQDTVRGWLRSLPTSQRAFADAEVARHGFAEPRRPWWGLIRLTFSSPARVAIVQAQDVLGLGSEARMNQPGSAGGSWRWRLAPGALTRALGQRLRATSEESGRLA